MSVDKDKIEGRSFVRCSMCEKRIDLAVAVEKAPNELPDSFVVRCPHCHAQSLRGKADIITLLVTPRRG